MPTPEGGRLAIWNRRAPEMRELYERWYQTEHLYERLAIPGFLRGRRYAALDDPDGFFTYYETATPEVMTSQPYLDRVNAPTPLTAQVMGGTFTDMSRTICKPVMVAGRMRGAFAATLRMPAPPDPARLTDWAAARAASVARVESWVAVEDATPQSEEARLRGGDARIAACLLVETLREEDCRAASKDLARLFGAPDAAVGVYRLLCDLSNDDGRDHAG